MIWIRLASLGVTLLIIIIITYGMYSSETKGRKDVLQRLLEDKKITMKEYFKYLKNK